MYYAIIQYMPESRRKERINIGLLAVDEEGNSYVRVNLITHRIKTLYPKIDTKYVWELLSAVKKRLTEQNVQSKEDIERLSERMNRRIFLTEVEYVQSEQPSSLVIDSLYARLVA